MKVKIDINQKEFDKAIIHEIARQIIENEYNESGISSTSWDNPARDILMEKARKVFQKDPKFEKDIMKKMKSQMNDKRLIKKVAKDMVEDNLRSINDD